MKKSSLNKNKTDNAASRYPRDETISMILLLFFMFISIQTQAQREDYNWIFGEFDDSRNLFSWDEDLNLSKDTVVTTANFYLTNSAVSDETGNLKLYFNGRKIYSVFNHEVIENGDSIGYGWYWNYASSLNSIGIPQTSFFLKSLSNSNNFLLFNLVADTLMKDSVDLLASVGVRSLNVSTIKNHNDTLYENLDVFEVLKDTLNMGGLTGCRHANGRDWWIVVGESFTNCIYVFLYSPDSIYLHHKNCDGFISNFQEFHNGVFSQDGSKFVLSNSSKGLKIFDFDRCSGQLALKEYISRDDLMSPSDPITYYFGYNVISPNSKYLYTGAPDSLFQFNLEVSDIKASKSLVYWIPEDSLALYTIGFTALAPDGTMPQPNHPNYYAIIHNPNEQAQDINLEMWLPLPKYPSNSMGNFPNYRLGRLIGSSCDTLYNSVSELDALDVLAAYPNPANDNIRIEYAGKFWEQVNNLHLKITNVLGQEYFNKKLPEYSAWQNINLTNYPSGVYFVYLMDQGKVLGTLRFVKR